MTIIHHYHQPGDTMTATKPPFLQGTISHGTLRFEDLAPAFVQTLGTLHPGEAGLFQGELNAIMALPEELRGDIEPEFLADVEDAINARLPEGYYFGTLEGDGSDWGIWQVEEDDAE